jgi:hypothetical protein
MIQTRMKKLAVALITLVIAAPSFAAELELRYGALERIIAEQLFTQDGRRYVRGNRNTRCQFAYLETPHIEGRDGRLRVTARFSGRTAVDLFNRCVGVGDSFDLSLTALPFPRDGAIALKDVQVSTARDSYYIRRVRVALAQSIAKDLKIGVRDQARRLLEQPSESTAFHQELAGFELGDIRVTPEALILVVEFRLVVK